MPGVSEQLAALPRMSKLELQGVWNQLFRNQPPCQLRRELMVRILAHRIQESNFGGLNDRTRRRICDILESVHAGSGIGPTNPHLKPGTRLIRQWKDQAHVVTVEERGFDYRGSRYESLSEIARTITGTRWSGPLFFGLKGNPEKRNGRCG